MYNFADMFRANAPSAAPSPLKAMMGHMISGGPAMPTPQAPGGLAGIGNALTGLQRPAVRQATSQLGNIASMFRRF